MECEFFKFICGLIEFTLVLICIQCAVSCAFLQAISSLTKNL